MTTTSNKVMARLSSENLDTHRAPTTINFTRLLSRLQQTLNSGDAEADAKLRASSFDRERIRSNLNYARGLLLQLEQEAQGIKVQSRKQGIQTDLVRKREALLRLDQRLEELEEFAEPETEVDSSEGEDLLGDDTPPETTEETTSQNEVVSPVFSDRQPLDPEPFSPPPIPQPVPEPNPTSELRSRNNPRAELFSSSSQTTGMSTATTEALMTHNRVEQETLTNSLLSMASALKNSSNAFSSSLEDEKTVLNRATEGLDKNELGLEAASRRMGYLRSMTEGRGWWGRMLMYAWIAGLMIVAILVVFVMPKLRF